GEVQQAPAKARQGSGVQTVRRPWKTPAVPHTTLVVTAHTAVALSQHAPTQGLGEQEEPTPLNKIFVPMQFAWEPRWQAPSLCERSQQAPGHGSGEQDRPLVQAPEHEAWVVEAQALAPLMQQAP